MSRVAKTAKQGKEKDMSAWVEVPGVQVDYRARWIMASGALLALGKKDVVSEIERAHPEPITLKYTNPESPWPSRGEG